MPINRTLNAGTLITWLMLVLVSLYPSTSAAVSDDIVKATTGPWLVASEDGSPGCRIMLQNDRTIGGYALREEKPCAGPLHDNVFAWDFSGAGIVLRDATRKVLMDFEEQEGGPWRTPEGVTPRIYFIPDPGTMERVPVAKNLPGSWVLSDKAGKPLCGIKLLDRPVPGLDGASAIELSKDCNAAVKKTKISAWQVSEIQLIIIGGEDWVYTLQLQHDGSFISDDKKYRLAPAKS